MKKTLIIILALLASIATWADNASEARKVLDKTAAAVSRKGGATAAFTISGTKIKRQSGTIAVKGNKFCATTPGAKVWYDGRTQWTYLSASQEVNVTTPTAEKQQMMNPYTFLTLYKSGYALSMKRSGKTTQVTMKATGKKSIREMYITIDAAYRPTQVRMNNGKGWTTIAVTNFQACNLSDSMFRFNSKDYPKAEVIDLR